MPQKDIFIDDDEDEYEKKKKKMRPKIPVTIQSQQFCVLKLSRHLKKYIKTCLEKQKQEKNARTQG